MIVGALAGKKMSYVVTSGPTSYDSTNGHAVTIPDLKVVDAVLSASIDGGYRVASYSISGNVVTLFYHYFDYPSTTAGPSVTVPNTTNLSGRTVKLVVLGS